MVYEPFEGTEGSSFVGSAGGIGWSNAWTYASGADVNIGNYGAFSSAYSDGTNALAAAGSAALIQGNTGPLERLVASSVTNLFGDGESVWISYRTRMEKTDRKTTGVTFGFNGGSLLVDLDSLQSGGTGSDDDQGKISLGTDQSVLIAPFYDVDFFFLIKIEFSASGTEQVTLWRDPSLASEPSAGSALVATSLELGTRLSAVSMNTDGTQTDGRFDEFRVGEYFADVMPTVLAPPMIVQFEANHNVVTNVGDSLTLNWDVAGADHIFIEPGIGAVSNIGNQVEQLASNTVYTLTATNGAGAVSQQIFTYIQDQMPPNILFIAIDDLKRIGGYFADDPGNLLQRVYPDPAVRDQVVANLTPNIDQLRRAGLRSCGPIAAPRPAMPRAPRS
jgi:hypothetical protein